MCLENLNLSYDFEHIWHLVIDCNLFSKLIFQIIEGSNLTTIYIYIYIYHVFKPLFNYLRVTNFYFD
jgi:hypothetical protein